MTWVSENSPKKFCWKIHKILRKYFPSSFYFRKVFQEKIQELYIDKYTFDKKINYKIQRELNLQ